MNKKSRSTMAVGNVTPASCDNLREWKIAARQSWGTKCLEYLSLLHPIAWWRVAAFKQIDLKPALVSATAILLPAAYLTLQSKSDPNRESLLSTYWFLPWTLAWAWNAAASINSLVAKIKEFIATRCAAGPLAWKFLASRIVEGRAYRKFQCDVYLPIAPTKNARPILFLTGAYVEHVAYAQPACLLADAGYLVVVVSAEPWRLIDTLLPRFHTATLQRLQRAIEGRHGCANDWAMVGHSMGSLACTKLAPALGVTDVVMWGSAPFCQYMNDVSDTEIRLLVVQATHDVIIDRFATPEATRRFWELLPASTTRHDIMNGTHSGFGNYISSAKAEVDGIPLAEQHAEAVKATVDFLEGRLVYRLVPLSD